uniref:Uncharacterized protein n=1 Tax=Cucumis melo TaxID=3656 RepID=A0A9I9ELU4_CUCME
MSPKIKRDISSIVLLIVKIIFEEPLPIQKPWWLKNPPTPRKRKAIFTLDHPRHTTRSSKSKGNCHNHLENKIKFFRQ